jgi:TolA-binding protein
MRSIHQFALLVGLVSTGCVSHWRGLEITSDIAALQGQVEQLLDEQRAQRALLKKNVDQIELQFSKIEATLKRAISKLQDDSVTSDSEMESLRAELAGLRGTLAKWQHEASQTKKPESKLVPEFPPESGAPKLPTLADELYRYGFERKKANDCTEANRAFFQFFSRFPRHSRADSSLYLAAQCQFDQKDYAGSIRSLRLILTKYKKGKKVDDALEMTHDAFLRLGKCKTALMFIEELVSEHPRYKHRRRARKSLRTTRRKCGKK